MKLSASMAALRIQIRKISRNLRKSSIFYHFLIIYYYPTYLITYFFQCPQNVRIVSWSVIQDFGSADPDPKEILTDPQYCFKRTLGVNGSSLNDLLLAKLSKSGYQWYNVTHPAALIGLKSLKWYGLYFLVLRIHAIFWHGSVPLTNGSGFGSGSDSGFGSVSWYFRQWPSRWQLKKSLSFFAYYFLKLHFPIIKS